MPENTSLWLCLVALVVLIGVVVLIFRSAVDQLERRLNDVNKNNTRSIDALREDLSKTANILFDEIEKQKASTRELADHLGYKPVYITARQGWEKKQ